MLSKTKWSFRLLQWSTRGQNPRRRFRRFEQREWGWNEEASSEPATATAAIFLRCSAAATAAADGRASTDVEHVSASSSCLGFQSTFVPPRPRLDLESSSHADAPHTTPRYRKRERRRQTEPSSSAATSSPGRCSRYSWLGTSHGDLATAATQLRPAEDPVGLYAVL